MTRTTEAKKQARRDYRKSRRALLKKLTGAAPLLGVKADVKHPNLLRLKKAWFMASPKEGEMFLKWVATNATRTEIDNDH